MTKIYANTPTCANHLKYLDVEVCHELDDAIDQAVFHLPYPLSADVNFKDKLNRAVKLSRCVVILCSELHLETVEFIKQHQHPKITYFLCGFINHLESTMWMDWLHRSSEFYKKNPQVLDQLNPYTTKLKMFDILLGRVKHHRSTVYNFIKERNLDDHVIMTYLKGNDDIPIQSQDQSGWLWEPGIIQLGNEFQWTVSSVRYQGQSMSLSQVVPISIYNQTAYTIVCETNYDNHYNFYTEKIVKPILAERLFIVFSGQYYLRNLRSLGFKTFDGIIDETYDSIADNDQRFKLACEQIQYLINQPQDKILEKIKPITEHNYHIMMSTEWNTNFIKELQAVLLDRTS